MPTLRIKKTIRKVKKKNLVWLRQRPFIMGSSVAFGSWYGTFDREVPILLRIVIETRKICTEEKIYIEKQKLLAQTRNRYMKCEKSSKKKGEDDQ